MCYYSYQLWSDCANKKWVRGYSFTVRQQSSWSCGTYLMATYTQRQNKAFKWQHLKRSERIMMAKCNLWAESPESIALCIFPWRWRSAPSVIIYHEFTSQHLLITREVVRCSSWFHWFHYLPLVHWTLSEMTCRLLSLFQWFSVCIFSWMNESPAV